MGQKESAQKLCDEMLEYNRGKIIPLHRAKYIAIATKGLPYKITEQRLDGKDPKKDFSLVSIYKTDGMGNGISETLIFMVELGDSKSGAF